VFAPDDCWAVRLGHAYPDDEAANAFICRHLATVVVPGAPSHVCVPLFAQGGMLGILLLFAPAISAETRSTAVAAAEQVSLAIANLRLQETLRTQSLRDPLTGLFNRRYLEASLARDLARAVRRSQPLAVLMLDIDHFKRFNDEFGHDGGDALLSQVGEVLASLVRNEDVACRYGGEEFTLVIQEADAAMALDRAEEIRKAIATLHLERGHKGLAQVTASIGIASYPQHGDTPEQLLKRADRALYTAKHAGRNQVWVADRI
jgi:diguanylate cyclase (GGDEF)-like protein